MITTLLHALREILLPAPGGPAQETADRWIRINGSLHREGFR